MSRDDLPTGVELTELDTAFRADPYPRLAELRARCPVRRDPDFRSTVLTRYEDVRAVVNDGSLWRNPSRGRPDAVFAQLGQAEGEEPRSILFMDEPDHSRVRGPLVQAFYKRAAKMRPKIESIVDEVLDAVAGRQAFDVIADFAIPVPILAIAAVLGIEAGRLREFREWSEDTIQGLNVMRTPEQDARLERANAALDAFFDESMADRRRAPKDDLITDMVRLQAEGAPLSDLEINLNLQGLLVGGNLTTTDLIGNGVKALLQHPDQLDRLRADHRLIAATVEEILRWDPPVTITSRIAPSDIQVAGETAPAQETLITYLRAANRDPAAFAEPDSFDIARKHAPHVSFGGGAHICIGAPLARMEAQAALWRLFERFPTLRLADQTLEWRPLPAFRGLERLIVEV